MTPMRHPNGNVLTLFRFWFRHGRGQRLVDGLNVTGLPGIRSTHVQVGEHQVRDGVPTVKKPDRARGLQAARERERPASGMDLRAWKPFSALVLGPRTRVRDESMSYFPFSGSWPTPLLGQGDRGRLVPATLASK